MNRNASKRRPSSPAPSPQPRRWVAAVAGAAVLGLSGWLVYAKVLQKPAPVGDAVAAGEEGAKSCCATMPPRVAAPAPGDAPPGMVWVAGGSFAMGDSAGDGEPQERPVHPVRVDGFFIDAKEVTNAQFRAFVDATKYVTTAERVPELAEIMKQLPPGTPPPPKESLVAGSLVYRKPAGEVTVGYHGDWAQWWVFVPGADWRHPEGPSSDIAGRDRHPVVQVSWDDAVAYCTWAGRRLPTEAEWEFAARGGLAKSRFVWGEDEPNAAKPQANIWQGTFPKFNTAADGFETTAPVGSFPPNGYGLYDMAGNVWEWCSDWYDENAYAAMAKAGESANPAGPDRSFDPTEPTIPKRAIRGGSFLCSDKYCSSYRPSARMRSSPDSATNHQGFRAVMSPAQWEEMRAKMAATKAAAK